jgi:hypothetical protein
MRIALVLSMTFALTATALAQSLSDGQIRQALVGHTISGVENGKSYSEYLNPNGTISGKNSSGAYSGRWRIARGEICFLYEDSTKGWDCNGVRLRGNTIIWDDNTTATLSGPSQMSSAPGRIPVSAYVPAYGRTPSYILVMPTGCPQPRGLFGGFCNCGCR